MCWSAEVSLFFSLMQFSIFLYVWNRNRYVDRMWVQTLLPIATQEFLQFLMWTYGFDENTTKDSCSTTNKLISFAIAFTILLLPFLFAYYSWYHSWMTSKALSSSSSSSSDSTKKEEANKAANNDTYVLLYKYHFYYQIFGYLFSLYIHFKPVLMGLDIFCTFLGIKKIQIWAVAAVEGLDGQLRHEIYKLGYVAVAPVLGTLQPRWIFIPVAIYMVGSFAVLDYYNETGAAASIWCLFNSATSVWVLLYKYIADFIITNKLFADSWWFKNTRQILEQYNKEILDREKTD